MAVSILRCWKAVILGPLCLLLALGSCPSSAKTPTEKAWDQLYFDVRESFLDEDFASLEKINAQLLGSEERYPTGARKVSVFYNALRAALSVRMPSDRNYQKVEERLARWAKAYPRSSVPPILMSQALSAHGWFYRGSGVAQGVSKAAFAKFEEYQSAAVKVLYDSRSFASSNPEWYVQLIDLATYSGWDTDQFEALFTEATKRYPLYTTLYTHAVDYFRPKWNGSVEELEQLADRAARQTRSRDGEIDYATVYWTISEQDFQDIFKETKVDWPRLRTGFDQLIKKYQSPAALNEFAHFACQAKDRDTATRLLKQIGPEPRSEQWPHGSYEECVQWTGVKIPAGSGARD